MKFYGLAMLVLGIVLGVSVQAASAAIYIGNDYRQVWNGTSAADYMEARGSGDEARGKGGGDDMLMGTGNDLAYGGNGNDYIVGGDGADWLYAGCDGGCDAGNNQLFGGGGNDSIAANNNRYDKIDCGDGYDHVWYDVGLDDVTRCEDYGSFAAAFLKVMSEEPTVSTDGP